MLPDPYPIHLTREQRPSKKTRPPANTSDEDALTKLSKEVARALEKRANPGDEKGGAGVQKDARKADENYQVSRVVVDEIRRMLKTMAGNGSYSTCTVCYVVRGEMHTGHISGNDCPESLCSSEDCEWMDFGIKLRFPKFHLCFACLLPTVSHKTDARPHFSDFNVVRGGWHAGCAKTCHEGLPEQIPDQASAVRVLEKSPAWA